MPGLGGPGWGDTARHADAVRSLVGAGDLLPAPERALPADVAVRLLGLIVVADWLVSQEKVIESRLPAENWKADGSGLR